MEKYTLNDILYCKKKKKIILDENDWGVFSRLNWSPNRQPFMQDQRK